MGIAENIEREFQVFIKPAGPLCNLNCSYCYYLDKVNIFEEGRIKPMDSGLLEIFVRQLIEATTEPVIKFSWHGGEPLLAGIDFYRKAVLLQKKLCSPGKTVLNGIQTNGTLLNEEWCRFLATEKFLVGISLDGPELLHDQFRRSKDGRGTFRKVMSGFDQLVMHGAEPEILCVVNAFNSKYPLEVYDFFRQLGVTYISFLPLVERTGTINQVSSRTVGAAAFGDFLCTIFDEWLSHDTGKIRIQIFEEALRTAFHQEHTLCVFKPVCGGVPVVEHNGDYYSCDHFVTGGYYSGNIKNSSIAQMLDGEMQKQFGRNKCYLPLFCKNCEVLNMCNGECPKNRFVMTPEGEPGLNYLCEGYRKFFNHCRPFIETLINLSSKPES